MAADIVAALASHAVLSPEEIDKALRSIFNTLRIIHEEEELLSTPGVPKQETRVTVQEPSKTIIDPLASIQRDKVICLECNKEFHHLTHTHLKQHGLTPKTYRKKYGIPEKQPLMAETVRIKKHIQATKLAEQMAKGRKRSKPEEREKTEES